MYGGQRTHPLWHTLTPHQEWRLSFCEVEKVRSEQWIHISSSFQLPPRMQTWKSLTTMGTHPTSLTVSPSNVDEPFCFLQKTNRADNAAFCCWNNGSNTLSPVAPTPHLPSFHYGCCIGKQVIQVHLIHPRCCALIPTSVSIPAWLHLTHTVTK